MQPLCVILPLAPPPTFRKPSWYKSTGGSQSRLQLARPAPSQLGPESPVLGLSSTGGSGLGPLWSRLPSGAKKLLREGLWEPRPVWAPPVCALEVLRCSQPPEPVRITSRPGEAGVWNHGYSLHPLTVRGDTDTGESPQAARPPCRGLGRPEWPSPWAHLH